jgi:protein AbiQ
MQIPPFFVRGITDMNIRFENLGLYNIDTDYLRYLNGIEPEVQFTQEKNYEQKPFLGILVTINTYSYFIPLTSGKPKHAKWKNVGPAHYLIYEQVKKTELRKRDIFKSISETDALKIFAALDLKKMIPVADGLYSRIEFAKLEDQKYADLLEKEYRFCQKIQDGILSKVTQIYREQKETGKVYPMYCNFSRLEDACNQYQSI